MSNVTSTIRGIYPLHILEILRDLLQQMARTILASNRNDSDRYARSVSNDSLQGRAVSLPADLPQFLLLQSPQFCVLIVGTIVKSGEPERLAVEIIFSPDAIDRFIEPLLPFLSPKLELINNTDFVNDSSLQNQFTQLLLTALVSSGQSNGNRSDREFQLQKQLERAQLLNNITSQIYQTLDLGEILQAAVERVQTFLHADRLIIYQFEFTRDDDRIGDKSFDAYNGKGRVAYEALGNDRIESVLNVNEHQDCFDDWQVWTRYLEGKTRAIDNVELEYADRACLVELMQRYQIKSKLIVPIVINSGLWGLAIAHQCQDLRIWQAEETKFLQQVAAHLALAIDRAEFYTDSIWHTQNLEQRVNERTRELRDATIVAQSANQSKTEFLALLSHELRTPLTSILGLSATLLRLPIANLTDRQQNYLQTIYNSGEHLSELIDDILDFYKLEVGKTLLKVSEFSLSKLLLQIVEIVRPKAERAKIDLELQILNDGNDITHIKGRDLRFRGDTKRIRQILLNILVNAIKFTPEHGKVAIRAWLEDSYAVFEIEDNGIGIEADRIPALFKKFYQVDGNYARNYEGMGLGLAIAQQLVELHGGWIDVESIVGSGSTFTVKLASQLLKLPERNDWQEMDRQLAFQDPELNPTPNKIILLQPNEDVANFVCDILTAARYQVTWLLSADSAFRQISMFEPDLLIVDLSIGGSVDRALENIRRTRRVAYTKIIAISTPEETINPITKQYIDDYLWKPINPEQLLRKIAKLLNPVEE